MADQRSWGAKLRGMLGIGDKTQNVLEILTRYYIDESQRALRIAYHAERMRYPHFRDKLRAIAADEKKHAGWIAEHIRQLGGILPELPEIFMGEKNSWQSLLIELQDQHQCAVELVGHVYRLRPDWPLIADTLQRIHDEGTRHREEIRDMLMRSDPQAYIAA